MSEDTSDELRTLVAEVAAAYFANSHVGVADIGTVIEQITKGLAAIGEPPESAEPEASEPAATRRLAPAQVRKSITPDALISFEDGRPYRTLKRHLSVRGLTGQQYIEKWGLPSDYPMVASSYSAARSAMAKSSGLGAKRTAEAAPAPASPRGRKRSPKVTS